MPGWQKTARVLEMYVNVIIVVPVLGGSGRRWDRDCLLLLVRAICTKTPLAIWLSGCLKPCVTARLEWIL